MSAPAASTVAASATATLAPSTSVLYTENGAQHFGRDDKRAKYRYGRLARESKHYFLGPMPVQQFLDTFLIKPHSELEKMPSAMGVFAGLPKLLPESSSAMGGQNEPSASQGLGVEGGDGPPKKRRRKRRAKGEGEPKAKEDSKEQEAHKVQEDPKVKAAQESLKQEKKIIEKSIYPHLVQALNPQAPDPPRCPGYIFCNTSSRADDAGGRTGAVKPDICCYSTSRITDLPYVDYKDAYTNAGLIATFIEVKAKTDFFCDPPPGTKPEDRASHHFVLDHIKDEEQRAKAAEALGQNIAYALEIFARQFRHCCYSVSVTCSSARLIRWDRAGAIVTEAFDLHKHPEFLCMFVWCFSKLSRADQGYDLTVEVANRLEEQLFEEAMLIHIASQTGKVSDAGFFNFRELKQHYAPGHVSRIRFTQAGDRRHSHSLLISRPIASPLSAFGRCTRGFWAVYCTWEHDYTTPKTTLVDWEIVFLKDTWRYDTRTDDVQEGLILMELHGKVDNIPQVIAHEDVLRVDSYVNAEGTDVPVGTDRSRCTETQDHFNDKNLSWVCGHAPGNLKLLKHTQYRMVLNIAGYPLHYVRGTKELFHASHDAFHALVGAAGVGRIHRDVTPANIILVRENGADFDAPRKGYLCDWDLSRPTDYVDGSDYDVSATWQFQAIEVIRRRTKSEFFPHRLEYDMESVLYVVLHCALLNLEVTGGNPADCIAHMFDAVIFNRDGDTWGGNGKAANALDRSYTSDLTWSCPDVKVWLDRVMELHRPVTTPLPQRADPANQWTAANLDAFWSQFLTQRPGLPLADGRYSHLLTAKEQGERFMSRFMRKVPNPAPIGHGVRGVVHKRAGSPFLDHETPSRKQPRIEAQPTLEPEPEVLLPSTEPPPSFIDDNSDDSDDEEHHGAMPPGQAALYPPTTASLSTELSALGPPFPQLADQSIDAYLATMYGYTSSPSAGTSSALTSSTAGQAYATRNALERQIHGDNRSSNNADAYRNHLERPVPMLHDAAWGQALAGPSHGIVDGSRVPRLLPVADSDWDAHLARSDTLRTFTTAVTRGPARANLSSTASTSSGKRRTRRNPGE